MKMKNYLILPLCSLLMLLAACSGKTDGNRNIDSAGITFVEVGDSLLPLPQPPASMTDPVKRADFVMMHFWDKLDFASAQARDAAFMEQNFATYTTLFGVASEKGRQKSADALLLRAAQTPEMLERMMSTAEKYLADPNSPMRNEDAFIVMLRAALGTKKGDAAQNERWNYALQTAMKNRPGTLATDFPVVSRDGKRSTLLELARNSGAGQVMLVFYDDDCENCARILGEMRKEKQIADGIASKQLCIIAVNATADPKTFHGSDKIPAEWLDNVPDISGGKTIDDLYSLPAMPVRYLLSPDGTVQGKDI